MAYICEKPKDSCKKCPHYRYDEDRNDYSCFATFDEKYGIKFSENEDDWT